MGAVFGAAVRVQIPRFLLNRQDITYEGEDSTNPCWKLTKIHISSRLS
jgi:hypothetical protein